MIKNMGGADRVIRIAVALVFFALIYLGKVEGVVAVVIGVLGAVFILTSLISWCPLYLPFGLATCKKKQA